MAPVAALAVAATAAAATTAAVAISATSLFQQNPAAIPGAPPQTVVPSTVRQVDSVTIPDYGNGCRLGSDNPAGRTLRCAEAARRYVGRPAGTAMVSGQVPGCFTTRQQMVVNHEAVAPGQQPTGEAPMPLEAWDNTVVTSTGSPGHLRRVCRSTRHRRHRPQPRHGREHTRDKRRLLHARRTHRAQQSDPRDGSA